MSSVNPRRIALQILDDISDSSAFSDIALERRTGKQGLSYQDRRLIRTLVFGVVENRILLDYQIREYSKVKLKKINNHIKNILRLGAYQILFLNRIPNSAAVDESVKLVKKKYPMHSGFVNAILRNIARSENSLRLPNRDSNPVEYLSVLYSHPEWMVERWIERYGERPTETLLKTNNSIPTLTVRPNLLKIDRNSLKDFFEKEGFMISDGKHSKNAICINHMTKSLFDMKEFEEGLFVAQDDASALVAEVLAPQAGDYVLDMCSAPGGKAFYMAEMLSLAGESEDNRIGKVVARDIHSHKIQEMERKAAVLGVNNIRFEVGDGTKFDKNDYMKFDKVLLDAPCSGFGIIRRKPEIKYNKSIEVINSLAETQLTLLKNAVNYLKIGGYIVYSTCTIEPEENEHVIEKAKQFFKEQIEIVSIGNYIGESTDNSMSPYIQLFPTVQGNDGFFICKIRRVG